MNLVRSKLFSYPFCMLMAAKAACGLPSSLSFHTTHMPVGVPGWLANSIWALSSIVVGAVVGTCLA